MELSKAIRHVDSMDFDLHPSISEPQREAILVILYAAMGMQNVVNSLNEWREG